ncbi:hypothetical protein GCM10010129_26980 [Streptomyces fumigatiscleroticus]|nr:hypothetical protein GCM10010129_26980 [Streptomyces fumigatiscleroticus]
MSGCGQFAYRLGAALGTPGAGGDAGAGVQHDIRLRAGQRGDRGRVQDAQPSVVGPGEARGLGEVEGGFGLVGVRGAVVAQIEQGAGVVLAVRGDAADAGQPQQQRGGQRGLVEGGQDQRGVGVDGVGQPFDLRAVDGRWPEAAPGGVPDQDVVDAGQQPRGRCAAWPAQQGDVVGAGGDGADGGPGEQDVAEAVEPGEECSHRALPLVS